MILILSGPNDDHARRVQAELDRRGVATGRLDPDQFSSLSGVAITLSGSGLLEGSVGKSGAPVQVEHVRAVYCAEPGNSGSNPYLDELWDVLDIGVVPGMPVITERSRDSVRQAHVAASVGFDLRSDSDELPTRLRVAVVGYRVFATVLPLGLCGLRPPENSSGRRSRRVARSSLLHSPGTVTAEQCKGMWAMAKPSAPEDAVCLDGVEISPAILPVHLAERCRDMVEQMGLEFATLDVALSTDGTALFCGLNPFGHFGCIEDGTGMPVTRAVVDLLLTEAAGGGSNAFPLMTHPSRTPRQIPFLRVARARR